MAPVEAYLRMLRNMTHQHAPSGQIVIVAIDDRSVAKLGEWPWSRDKHAAILDKLNEMRPARVFYDVMFTNKSEAPADAAFAAALARSRPVFMPGTFSTDPFTGRVTPMLPNDLFRRHVGLAGIEVRYTHLAAIPEYSYTTRVGANVYPSMPAVLANKNGNDGEVFPIDYSLDLRKVRTISIADIMADKVLESDIAGKDAIIAVNSREMGDLYFLPGRGLVNGALIMVAAAETLKAGRPVALGWLLPTLGAFLLAIMHLMASRRWVRRIALAMAVLGVTALPMLSEAKSVFFDVMPAVVLIGSVAISWAWSNFRRSYKVRGDINAISGLPNLNALRREKTADQLVLVAARVRNYAEISTALPTHDERALVEQITGRIALGARGARIFQGDEGVFVWATTPDGATGDHLDALHALFRSPALLDGRSIDLSVTFGVDAGVGRDLANRVGATLVAADEAAAEGARWKTYDPAKLADAEWKLSLLGRLDAAIDSGEVWVAYQPQLDVRAGRISGAEALVRWSHPEKGEISPAEFVLAAEQHDRIDKLTAFVLTDAIRVAAEFNARGIEFDVAVNLSARLLERPGLTDTVRGMLADARLAPERLTLEVTESAAMTSGRASIRTLEELGSLGITVSIDDYGTGFSTLEYFKLIPAAEVKIDRSFVVAIDRSASDRLMVQSTIDMAHSLGRHVVAEGVETPQILTELTKMGCDKIQGYLIGKPMKAEELARMVAGHAAANAA
jgi:EAL domain-containing protein (putative c-di-GMP-specific phosphodiesterase class I)/CHASE2 domain-containing sensor protein